MPGIAAARRYAEAAFQIATAERTVDAWQKDLAVLARLAGDERTARAIDNPAVAFDHRRKAVEEILAGRVARPVENLALLLAERGRFALLGEVSARYDDLVRASRGIAVATVTSAGPLAPDELAAVRARAEQLAGERVELITATDPALIGGLTLRIGDRLIDASVRGRLERLRERLVQETA